MATQRKRGNTWHFVVRRKHLLPKPIYLTFDSEEEGKAYVKKLEALLDRGVVPTEFAERCAQFLFIGDVIRAYLTEVSVPETDRKLLNVQYPRIGTHKLTMVDYEWAESWIARMKREHHLTPTTIRHHNGALARCFDWASRRGTKELTPNPLRMLPRRYATYSEGDEKVMSALEKPVPEDTERDRRLAGEEELRIRTVLDGQVPAGSQRSLSLPYQAALELLFDLALESAMRLREMFTIELSQINLPKRTVFLEKTKNGDKRQVPLTSIAVSRIKAYETLVKKAQRGMAEFSAKRDRLFPWWDGDASSESLNKTTTRLSRQFSRVFEAAGCADFRFHDLRHEATSRLYERTQLSDLEIAKITGHKDLRMLRRYANLRGSTLANKLW